MRGLFAALQQQTVGRGHRERGHLRKRVRTRFENDKQNTDRNGDLLQVQALSELRVPQHSADVLKARVGDLLQPNRQALQLGRREGEAREQRLRNARFLRLFQVLVVRFEDVCLFGDEQIGQSVNAQRSLIGTQQLQLSAADSGWNFKKCYKYLLERNRNLSTIFSQSINRSGPIGR